MSIHPEGQSYGHIRYRLECLLSMSLLQGCPIRALCERDRV